MMNQAARAGTLTFEFVRSFLFLKESDFWQSLNQQDREAVFELTALGLKVFQVRDGALLDGLISDDLRAEGPIRYFIETDDECLEILGFENPTWTPA
jgi:hypothetical protein